MRRNYIIAAIVSVIIIYLISYAFLYSTRKHFGDMEPVTGAEYTRVGEGITPDKTIRNDIYLHTKFGDMGMSRISSSKTGISYTYFGNRLLQIYYPLMIIHDILVGRKLA